MERIKLNLGCGHDVREGWTNVEHPDKWVSEPDDGSLVYHDLTEYPWPFSDGQAEHILMREVLEHLPDPLRVMDEVRRVLGMGNTVKIVVPHVLSPQGFNPWDHTTYWTKSKLAWLATPMPSEDAANMPDSFEIVDIGSDRSTTQILREWWNWGHPVRIEAVFRRIPIPQ